MTKNDWGEVKKEEVQRHSNVLIRVVFKSVFIDDDDDDDDDDDEDDLWLLHSMKEAL